MTILPGHYIELINSNTQNFLSEAVDGKTQIQQDLAIDLVSLDSLDADWREICLF